jgi:hypothetical protein
MHSAVRSVRSSSSGSANPGAVTNCPAPACEIASSTFRRSGPSPKTRARSRGTVRRAMAIAGGIAAARFSRMCRPAKTTSGSASFGVGIVRSSPWYMPWRSVGADRRPSASSRSRCMRL